MLDWLISFIAAACLVGMVVLGMRELAPLFFALSR